MLGTQTLAGTLLGTQTLADNDALSPGGTLLGTQTLGDTPQKKHKAWLYEATSSTTAGEAAELRKFNAQSIRNARKKARGAEEPEEPEEPEEAPPPRDSLAVRALRLGIGQGEALGLAQGDTRRKKHFLRKSAEPSSLLRNEMLKTRGRMNAEPSSLLMSEMLSTPCR